MCAVGFSLVSAITGGGFVSVSNFFCRAFWDLEVCFPRVLKRISLLSLPTNVSVGLRASNGGLSLSTAIFAASYAKLWTIELQKRIASVASSKVRLLDFIPRFSSTRVDSSEICKERLQIPEM